MHQLSMGSELLAQQTRAQRMLAVSLFRATTTHRAFCRSYSFGRLMSWRPLLFGNFGNSPKWGLNSGRSTRFLSSIAESSSTLDVASTLKIDDSKLVKAIVYEANNGFCDSTGSTTKFSDFLESQLSVHAERIENLSDPISCQLLRTLAEDAKSYSEMNQEQRVELLDRVAQIQGFSCAKDIVEHESAVAEAIRNFPEKFSNEAPVETPPIVYGSSDRIDLFNIGRTFIRPGSSATLKVVPCLQKVAPDPEVPLKAKNVLEILPARKLKIGAPDSEVPLKAKNVIEILPARKSKIGVKPSDHHAVLRDKTMKSEEILEDNWNLDTPISRLRCFTAHQRSQLQENGFYTARGLLNHFPRAHVSYDNPTETLEDGQVVSLFGTVLSAGAWKLRNALAVLEVILKCTIGETEKSIILHNKKYFMGSRFTSDWFLRKVSAGYTQGATVVVSGKVKTMKIPDNFEMKDFNIKVVKDFEQREKEGEAYAVYSSRGLLHPKKIQTYVQRILSALPLDIDPLPLEIREKYELLSLHQAYIDLHNPNTLDAAHRARRRVVFDDFFYLQLAFLLQRRSKLDSGSDSTSGVLEVEKWCNLSRKILNALPFKLTAGQVKAASEIMWDLRQPAPMSRLLQGDVGCGKTIVAFLALLDVVSAGYQAAIMAPTEFVAKQHYENFISWLELLDENDRPKIAFLAGSTSPRAARLIREDIANKDVQLVVGTHTLISNSTQFPALGLAVIDEQHRFGVFQRDRLKAHFTESESDKDSEEGSVKLASTTHVLLMSATPIPRSLALTIHGDMSVSQITELPAGRSSTATVVLPDNGGGRKKAYEMVARDLEAGGRAFFVYPVITETTDPKMHAAVDEFEKISKKFGSYKCGLVHGRMKSDAKNQEMRKFREGEYQILVATRVIEVGVDIPDATVMVVGNAEHFGLAQLHQLRGRVGRGNKTATCILLSSMEAGMERLKLLENSNDGFFLAEADLKLRGPGDLLGKRQSGQHLEFVLAHLGEDNDVLELAREAATELLEACNRNLDKFPMIKHEINIRQLPKSWS